MCVCTYHFVLANVLRGRRGKVLTGETNTHLLDLLLRNLGPNVCTTVPLAVCVHKAVCWAACILMTTAGCVHADCACVHVWLSSVVVPAPVQRPMAVPLPHAALLMVRDRAAPAGRGLLQCPMCSSKRCTSHESLAAHCIRHHKSRVERWAASHL